MKPAVLLLAVASMWDAAYPSTALDPVRDAFQSATADSDPIHDVRLTVEFTSPDGVRGSIAGFWDSDNTRRVRFSPNQPGKWNVPHHVLPCSPARLEVVAAGKGKNNRLDRAAVPEVYEAEAHRRGLNPNMLVVFVDGSKNMIEMACFANATGLVPEAPNMHGLNTSVSESNQVFRSSRMAASSAAKVWWTTLWDAWLPAYS